MTLKFSPSGHRYWLDGKPVPGVTTLIGKGLPKPALPYWAAKCVAEYVADQPDAVDQLRMMGRAPMVAALKEVPWQARDEAAIRGTDVHALAERLVHGLEVEVPEHLLNHVEGYARFLDRWQVEPVLTEHAVASRKWWYAGTFDLIADVCALGKRLLVDLKTSKGVYGETALQTAAYASAEFYTTDGSDELPVPEVDGIAVVHVTTDGSALYDLGDITEAFRIFTHVSWVAQQTDRIKQFVTAQLTPPSEDAA